VVAVTTRQLINKLMHDPSVALREAGAEGRTEILDIVRELFDIKASYDGSSD